MEPQYKYERIVPDTSVLIDGILSNMITKGILDVEEIIIHEASMSELEHQANMGRDIGFQGIKEIQKLKELSDKGYFILKFSGRRPTPQEIRLASSGEIDAMIRQLAIDLGATLVTMDRVQAEVAKAYGLSVLYLGKHEDVHKEKLSFEKWFDENTTSLHIKEGVNIIRKKGFPGEWILEELPIKLSYKEVEELANEILEAARVRHDSFIEISTQCTKIVQLGYYRIVIVSPPVSDGWEITIVKPIKKLKIEDYKLPEKILKRLEEKASGIIVAGAPGHGKTTFVQALAEWYASKGKIVKTLESPRDLNVIDKITQYSKNFATSEEIHDILLLARPDYVVFDEMRDTPDFELYTDLRLAGVGMIGVLHATEPIEAVQRFIGRLELGMIPHVLDTIIFIRKGNVDKIYSLELVVKLPTGMTEADLTRPVVEIRDYLTGELEYEIYKFGEETMLVPIKRMKKTKTPIENLVENVIKEDLRRFLKTRKVRVEIVSPKKIIVYVPEEYRAKLIGKKGRTIEKFERLYKLNIEVRSYEESLKEGVEYEIDETKKYIILRLPESMANKRIGIYSGNRKIASLYSDENAEIRINKKSRIAKNILEAVDSGILSIKEED